MSDEQPKKPRKRTAKKKSETIPEIIAEKPPVETELVMGDPDIISSHVPVLGHIIDAGIFDELHVLEFGPGIYSTPLLIDECESVTSIEKNPGYVPMIREKCDGIDGDWTLVVCDHGIEPKIDWAKYQLVFVDGEHNERVKYANLAFENGVPIVVIHDTERVGYYGLQHLKPGSYLRFTFLSNTNNKQTTVFVADRSLGPHFTGAIIDGHRPKWANQ